MNEIFNSLGIDKIITLFERLKELMLSCVGLIGDCFGWLGPEFAVVLSVGVGIAILLRILGR